MVDIIDLCEYIIYYSNIEDYGISCLKLQKILYFLQAEWMITKDTKLFIDKIIAWDIGPVILRPYKKYIMFGGTDIPRPNETDKNNFSISKILQIMSKKDIKLINDLIDYFKVYSASTLTSITQHQSPWIESYSSDKDNEVTCEAIKKYFTA